MRFGYARVLDDGQPIDRQRHTLVNQGCDQITEEIEGGVKARRRLDALLTDLQLGDEIVFSELDCLGCDTGEAILIIDGLLRRGISVRVLAMPLQDRDGQLLADIVGYLAAHERRVTRSKQRLGIDAARREGRHLGRPPKLSGQQISEVRDRLSANEPACVVARDYNITARTLRATLARTAAFDAMEMPRDMSADITQSSGAAA